MALLSNVPTLSYIRWQNLLIIYKDEVYQIYNNHTNKPFIYFDAINSPNELIMSNKKLEERDGLFYIIFNDNGKYIIVPQTEIEINFSENGSADAVSSKILGFKEQLNEQSQKVTTIETDVEGVKTTVNQFEESITKNETSISTLEQRANEIDAEVEKITIDFNDDIVIRELRENTTMAILSIQSTLGLFSSDMNTYMKDNRLSNAETDEINAYKENLNNELTLMNLQTNNVIDLLEDKGEVEKVTRLNTAIEKLNTAINNLYTNIDTCSVDNVFTNNEIATIISYFGKANVAINELKNLIDECIYLSLGGRLVEEIGKIIVKQDQIQLSVSKNENSIRSTLSKEMTLVQDVVDENIVSLNNFRNCLNTISTDGAFTSDEIDVITTRANDLDVNFDEMTSKKSEIEGNTLLSDEQKEEIDKSYTNYKTAHNNLLSNINTITADGLMTTEEMISINEEIENYKNEINNMNTVLCSSLEEINKNGITTDINNVDKKWAEIILDPENGIQSQVGDIQKQINDDGGIIERLNTAEQKITTDAIINTVSSTFYSKEEVDNRLDDIGIGLVVKSIDVMYYLSTSNKTLEGGTWVTEAPSLEDGGYIWSKTVTTYTNESKNETDPICITGGKDGVTLYTWIKYSDNEDGSNMYDVPTDNTLYIGIATNKESETESSNPSDYTWSKFKGANGNSYYTWIRYADDKDGNGISDNPTDKLYIGFAYNKTTSTESNNPSDYTWSLIKGKDGVDGTSVKILGTYDSESELNTAHPSGNEIGDGYIVQGNLYIWTGTIFENVGQIKGEDGKDGVDGVTLYTWIKYSDNEDGSDMYDTPTDKTKYIGIATNKITQTESNIASDYKWSKFRGDDGVDGTDGKGILTVVDYYKVYASDIGVTNATSGFSTDVPQMDATNKYLWSYELITYTDNSTTKTNARVIGVYGENGTDGKGISSIVEYYAVNNSSETVPTSFGTTIPTINATNRFLWNYEVIKFTDGSEKTTDKRIIGVYGETGETGKGINNIVEQYYLSTSKVSQTGGSWVDTPPTWVKGKYMWTRSKITYSDNSIEYTTPICDSTWEISKDLQDQIDYNKEIVETTKSTVAKHSTSLSDITSKVETNESKITTINGNVASIEKRISTAEQKITDDAIINTVSSTYATKEAVNNLELGTRNYQTKTDTSDENILNSWRSWYGGTLTIQAYTWGKNDYPEDSFIKGKNAIRLRANIEDMLANNRTYVACASPYVTTVEKNTTYTLSFWMYLSGNSSKFEVRAYHMLDGVLNSQLSSVTRTEYLGRFEKVTMTFTTKDVSNEISLRFYNTPKNTLTTGTADIHLYHIMLAKGNKEKDWVIAQEDMVSDINGLDNRISKAELKITDDAITTTVSKNFVSQSSFNSLELGNRNYLLYTNFDKNDATTKWSKWGGCSLDIPNYNGGQLKDIDAHINGKRVLRSRTKIETQIANNAQYGGFAPPYVTLEKNTTYTFSCWLYQTSTVGEMQVRAYYVNRETNSLGSEIKRVTLPGTWTGSFQKVTLTFTVGTQSDLVSIRFYNYHDATLTTGNSDMMVYQPMLTKGDKAKDWVEATEEVSLGIIKAQSQITQLADEISFKVSKGDVNSIIRQSPSDIQIGFNGINDRIEINSQYMKFEAGNGNRDMLLYGGQVCVYNSTDNTFMSTLGSVLKENPSYRGVGFLTGKNCNAFFIGRDSSWDDVLTNRSPNPQGVFYINFTDNTGENKGVHIRDNLYTTNNIQAIYNSQPTITGFKNISCTNSIFDNWKSVVDESTIMRFDGGNNVYLGKNLDGNGFIATGFKDIICTNSMFNYWKSIADESTIMRYDGSSYIYLGKNLYGNGYTAIGFSTITASQFTVSNSSSFSIARGEIYDPKNGSVNRDYVRLDGTFLKGGTSEICFIRASDADWANIYAGTIYSKQTAVTSDMNLKTDIRYVNIDPQTISESSGLMAPNVNITTEDMHEFIETLPMVSYRMKDDVKNGIDDTYYGFLAQEVLYTKVGSELIKIEETTNEKGETNESYRYSENKFASFIAGALQEEIKERKEEIENLNNTIIGLEERIKDLENKLNK